MVGTTFSSAARRQHNRSHCWVFVPAFVSHTVTAGDRLRGRRVGRGGGGVLLRDAAAVPYAPTSFGARKSIKRRSTTIPGYRRRRARALRSHVLWKIRHACTMDTAETGVHATYMIRGGPIGPYGYKRSRLVRGGRGFTSFSTCTGCRLGCGRYSCHRLRMDTKITL